jgi:hypothetical protein
MVSAYGSWTWALKGFFAVHLDPATPERYWTTVWRDFRTARRSRLLLVLVGGVTLAAAIAGPLAAESSSLSIGVKIVLYALGGGVGAVIVVGVVVFAGTLFLTPFRQRNEAVRQRDAERVSSADAVVAGEARAAEVLRATEARAAAAEAHVDLYRSRIVLYDQLHKLRKQLMGTRESRDTTTLLRILRAGSESLMRHGEEDEAAALEALRDRLLGESETLNDAQFRELWGEIEQALQRLLVPASPLIARTREVYRDEP